MPNPRPILRLGTRASLLARTQSQLIANLLAPHFPGTIQLTLITTTGDKRSAESTPPDAPSPIPDTQSTKSDFTKELEEALLAGTIDFAVHSAKDLPTQLPPGLTIASTPTREIPNDMWIGHNGLTIEQLPSGAIVGTSSLRRQAQLLALRPDLKTIPLRGNIDTRLKKVALGTSAPLTQSDLSAFQTSDFKLQTSSSPLHGTFLAAAGLRRANLVPPTAILLPTDQFIPAPGQGTLALECRSDDTLVRDLLTKIHDPITAASLACERRIIRTFSGNCLSPIGVCAEPRTTVNNQPQTGWIVRAIIATPDGKDSARATLLTEDPTPTGLAALTPKLIETLESRGGRAILSSHR